jgi:hypothetical protein
MKMPTAYHQTREENIDSNIFNDTRLARIIPVSTTIGRIKSVKLIDHGINYDEPPTISAPFVAVVNPVGFSFIVGETVYDSAWTYTDTVNYSDGPHGTVRHYDASNSILQLDNATDEFLLISENDDILTYESGDTIHHEYSFPLNGTTLSGKSSGQSTTILYIDRAGLYANIGSTGNLIQYFKSNASMPSDIDIRIHDGKQIQDFAYTITTFDTVLDGVKRLLQLKDYEGIVKQILHPAGYRMFGKTQMINNLLVPLTLPNYYGNETGGNSEQIFLEFTLDAVNLFKDVDLNAAGVDDSRLYHALTLLIEKYIQIFKDINYDTAYGTAFKYRMVEVLLNKLELFVPLTNYQQDKMIIIEHDVIDDGKYWFTPADLDAIKFSLTPSEGINLTPEYNFGLGLTPIGEFASLSIDEINTDSWVDRKKYNYVRDSYTTVIV